MKIKLDNGDVWETSSIETHYCPSHGKCPAIIDFVAANGAPIMKTLGASRLFYCKKCGAIKIVNMFNTVSNLCEALEVK